MSCETQGSGWNKASRRVGNCNRKLQGLYFISSLLWISFSLDGLSLIFHLQGRIWKPSSSLIYYVSFSHTEALCSSFPKRETLVGP